MMYMCMYIVLVYVKSYIQEGGRPKPREGKRMKESLYCSIILEYGNKCIEHKIIHYWHNRSPHQGLGSPQWYK